MIKILFSLVLGFIIAWVYDFTAINIFHKDSLIFFGYRLHHSLYGLLFIFLGAINKRALLIGLGVGIIIQHTVTDGFRFLSKEL